MPSADSLVPIIVAAAGALGFRELVGGFLARGKISAEAQASAAGAVATGRTSAADAADTITDAAAKMLERQEKRLADLEERDRQKDVRIRQLETRERNHTDLLEQHAAWDRAATRALAERGVVVDAAPPLYPDVAT